MGGTEPDLLIACARAALGIGPRPGSGDAPPGVAGWEALIARARAHGLLSVLYRELHPLRGLAPPAVWSDLERRYLHQVARSMFLARELFAVLDALKANGVGAIPFKGLTLAARAYGDTALRQCDDLDFLVRERDMAAAFAALASRGYGPEIELTAAERRRHLRAGWGVTLFHPEGSVTVDIRSNVCPAFFSCRVDEEELWADLETVEVEGRNVRTFPPETQLVLLSVHGTKHLWGRLMWICDVAGLVARHVDADWGLAVSMARRAGGSRMLALGAALAERVMGVTLPAELRREVDGDRAATALADRVLTGGPGPGPIIPSQRATLRFHLRARERPWDRIRYVLTWVLTPGYSDWRALRLPERMFAAYYVLRPFRLLRDWAFGRTAGRRGRRLGGGT